MDEELRERIWDGMVDTHRLHRYYGSLAGRLASQEKWTAILVSTAAFVGLFFVATDRASSEIVFVSLLIAAIASIVPLVRRVGGTVTRAAHTQERLALLLIEWEALWGSHETLSPEEALGCWQSLSKKKTELTALSSTERYPRRLRDTTEKEAYAYCESKEARSSSNSITPATT
jgi:uncharacterized membrane protein YhaH (DUF805 family)